MQLIIDSQVLCNVIWFERKKKILSKSFTCFTSFACLSPPSLLYSLVPGSCVLCLYTPLRFLWVPFSSLCLFLSLSSELINFYLSCHSFLWYYKSLLFYFVAHSLFCFSSGLISFLFSKNVTDSKTHCLRFFTWYSCQLSPLERDNAVPSILSVASLSLSSSSTQWIRSLLDSVQQTCSQRQWRKTDHFWPLVVFLHVTLASSPGLTK